MGNGQWAVDNKHSLTSLTISVTWDLSKISGLDLPFLISHFPRSISH
jgi:hypothetical protein